MKVAVICDTHFGVRGDSELFLNYQEQFYREIFFPYLDTNNITTLLHLGDLFDRRKYVNFVTLKRVREIFLDELKKRNIQVHGIVGNHDTAFKNTNKTNSTTLLLNEYENYKVYTDKPVVVTIDNCDIMLSPWICHENREASFEAFNETSVKVLMGHFEFMGFEMMKGRLSEHGLNYADFKKFFSIYSGHYHHQSSVENITYLGAPYEMTWSDYAGKRGFHIFDTKTLDMVFVPNTYSIFNKIEYDDTNLTIEDVQALEISGLTNTIVKVIIKKKTNPYIFDMFIDKLQSVCADIKIIEDSLNFDMIDEEIIDEAQDTPSLLRSYIDGLELNADKTRVNQFLHDLYYEAVSL